MKMTDIIKLGNRIQVKIGDEYRTTIVEGVGRDGVFDISNPWFQRRLVRFKSGQTLTVSCTTERGLLSFTVLVLETATEGNVPIVRVVMTSEPKRIQRRMGYRAPVMLEVVIREEPQADEKKDRKKEAGETAGGKETDAKDAGDAGNAGDGILTKTVNLSETGMLFLSEQPFPMGSPLRCDLILNRFGIDTVLQNVSCAVRRCLPPETQADLYKIGVMFHNLSTKDRSILAKFILYSQWNRNEGEARA